jgi:hypothetical protein
MMPDSGAAYPPAIPPVLDVFFKALLLAEKESAPEIGVDHLFAALNSPTTESRRVEQSAGPYVPAPHRDKAFSSEARAAVEAACALAPCDLERLTIDSLRAALAARRDHTK